MHRAKIVGDCYAFLVLGLVLTLAVLGCQGTATMTGTGDADLVSPAANDGQWASDASTTENNVDADAEGAGGSDSGDDVNLIVTDDGVPPIADAGDRVTSTERELVTLDGSGSYDADGDVLSFTWAQTGTGIEVVLDDASNAIATFVAPQVDEDIPVEFTLTVDDGIFTAEDTVTVIVSNLVEAASVDPMADAGDDQEVTSGNTVTLDGGDSWGSGNGTLTFLWTQISGTEVTLSSNGDPVATFVASDAVGDVEELVFQLEVTEEDLSSFDEVVITVQPLPEPVGLSGGGSVPPEPECTIDANCDDGIFCNGAETCIAESCQAGNDPCPGQLCDEANDACVDCLIDGNCDDGLFCNGAETCVAGSCQAGNDPCPGQSCDEANDACVDCLVDGDCDDGLFCTGVETCVAGACVAGTDPCPWQQCNEAVDVCEGLLCDGPDDPFLPAQQVGTIQPVAINEASGLSASRQNQDVLWTHNDSGGGNVIYALRTDGTLLGTYTIGSGSAVDTEDIAIGPGPTPGVDYIYWGDIGDNGNSRSKIVIKRVAEPVVDPDQAPVSVTLNNIDLITLQYPTGADAPSEKDAETMFVDPVNGDVYVVTKRAVPNRIYRAAYPQSTSSTIVMERVVDLPSEFDGTPGSWDGGPTGGEVSPDGSLIIIRQYSWKNPAAAIWYRPAGTNLWDAFAGDRCDVSLQSDGAGEAICWDPDGLGFYTTQDERNNAPIWYFERNMD